MPNSSSAQTIIRARQRIRMIFWLSPKSFFFRTIVKFKVNFCIIYFNNHSDFKNVVFTNEKNNKWIYRNRGKFSFDVSRANSVPSSQVNDLKELVAISKNN